MIKCSVGIFVYNEEKNIGNLIDSLLGQKLSNADISEILVIASGSSDKTVEIVKKYLKTVKKMKLIHQVKREGKASAVNLFIASAKSEVLVLLGGDLILDKNTIERLVREFKNTDVGMAGSHPVPVNKDKESLVGFSGNLLWELHHRLSLKKPKMGEVVAFRKIFRRIPIFSSVDEANIEPLIRGQGYIMKYVANAKVFNKTPTTVGDFIRQRRRIYNGHLTVKNEQSYEVSTMNLGLILSVLLSLIKENFNLKFIIMSMLTVFLEGYSRFLGWQDYRLGKRHTVWEVAKTTKELN